MKNSKNSLIDSTNYSVESYLSKFKKENFVRGFLRYRKILEKRYSYEVQIGKQTLWLKMLVVTKLVMMKLIVLFLLLMKKKEHISDSTKYEDQFIDPFTFTYMSKSNRRIDSREVQIMLNQKLNNIRLPLFIKKK